MSFSVACKQLQKILGKKYFNPEKRVLYPKNSQQVQKCLQIANRYKITLHPISTGKNWGYGNIIPEKNSFILDLHRLNKIIELNKKLGYVVIQPGVTFRQLFDYLRSENSGLIMTPTGSSPETSVIANTLERGVGKGFYGDRLHSACAYEVISPEGKIIHTGFGQFKNAKTRHLHRLGLGPNLDNLFSQSNFGVVTQMTVWLQKIPEYLQLCTFKIKTEKKFLEFIDILQTMAAKEIIRPVFSVINDYKMLMLSQQYPWEETSVTPLPEKIKSSLMKKHNIFAWQAGFTLSSPNKKIGILYRSLIKKYLAPYVHDLSFIDASKEECEEFIKNADLNLKKGTTRQSLKRFILSNQLGTSLNTSIANIYWRKKTKPPTKMDPYADQCGITWIAPAIPFTSHDIKNATSLIKKIMLSHGFEPGLTISFISSRCALIIGGIVYDKENRKENKSALACQKQLISALAKNGYYPYRLPITAMNILNNINPSNKSILKNIKQILDPNHILSPGRYET